MSQPPSHSETSSIRSSMQRRPAHVGKIEKARDPRNALIRLLPYLSPFKVLMASVFVGVVIYTMLGLVGPYLLGVAIDRFIVPKQLEGLGLIALLMLGT
jgi:ATP-binding cassette subfamily B protein